MSKQEIQALIERTEKLEQKVTEQKQRLRDKAWALQVTSDIWVYKDLFVVAPVNSSTVW